MFYVNDGDLLTRNCNEGLLKCVQNQQESSDKIRKSCWFFFVIPTMMVESVLFFHSVIQSSTLSWEIIEEHRVI